MTTGSGATRWEGRFKRLRTIALSAPVVLIVALHAVILLRRVGDASITRPVVLGQWAFAAVLLAAALFVRRALSRNGGRRRATASDDVPTQSGWIGIDLLAFAPFSSAVCFGDRAPPRF